jgi:hypothetical protein
MPRLAQRDTPGPIKCRCTSSDDHDRLIVNKLVYRIGDPPALTS